MNWALYRLENPKILLCRHSTIILDPSEAVKQAINKPKNAKIELCMDASIGVTSHMSGCIHRWLHGCIHT